MKPYALWKRSAASFLASAALITFSTSASTRAQAPNGSDTTSSTTEDSTGPITAVSGETISVTSRRGSFTYRIGPDVHILGAENEHLKISDLHVGQQATVYYYQRDGQATAARIVLLKADTKSGEK